MMKVQLILTLCSLSQAAYVNRIVANSNRLRAPTPFRPGFSLHRTWTHPRVVQAASNRAPYILYRNPPKFPSKHYALPGRHFYKGPWKTSAHLPPLSISTPEYEFMRAASALPAAHSDGGAIHTIPAPNLSLSEKPIVVLDTSGDAVKNIATEESKPIYEVTEKYPEVVYPMPKLERPIGFSKATSIATPTLQALIGSGAPFQLSPDYDISALNIHQTPTENEQFTIQGYHGLPTQQELRNTGAEGIIIPPNALYHNDPMFVQKLQNHLLQQFPAVEFIPYAANTPQIPLQPGQLSPRQPIVLVQEEDLKQEPSSFIPSIEKNIFQRQIQKNSFIEVIPAFIVNNVTEKSKSTSLQPHNITLKLVTANAQPVSTSLKYIIENTTEATTPIYYAQVGQTVGNLVAKGFYATMNDAATNEVRDTAAFGEEKSQPTTVIDTDSLITTSTTTEIPESKTTAQNITEKTSESNNLDDVKFPEPLEAVNVSYTFFRNSDALLRPDDKESKMIKDGAVYAGQIVEATISEDHDFNKEKATLLLKRAPIRLLAISDVNSITTQAPKAVVETAATANVIPKIAVIKRKVSPNSKMIIDDKTGEPILRIYASYVKNPAQSKDNGEVTPVTEMAQNWKSSTVKSAEKTQGFEGNQVSQFGLKLRLRKEHYVPLFEDYDKWL